MTALLALENASAFTDPEVRLSLKLRHLEQFVNIVAKKT
jgi:hypothetical protein